MSFKDIKNLINQNGNISLDKLNSVLQRNNADQETTKVAQSIFTMLDNKETDGEISAEEWENLEQDYEKLDENGDGIISEEEVQKAPDNSLFKIFGEKINEFIEFVKQALTFNSEEAPNPEENVAVENDSSASQTSQLQMPDNSYQRVQNGDSTTDISYYNDDQHQELKIMNFTPNSKNNVNVTNLNLIQSEGYMIGHVSYIKNGGDSTTSYGIDASNINHDDFEDKKLDLSASVNKMIEHTSNGLTENKDYGATISFNGLNFNQGRRITGIDDLKGSNFTVNADFNDLGNFDAKHTYTVENSEKSITNTQMVGLKNKDLSATFTKEQTDNIGNKKTKSAGANYNTEQNIINVGLNNSFKTDGNSRTNSLILNSATDTFNTQATFNNARENSDGTSTSVNLSAGYNEDLNLQAQHSRIKKRSDDITITNTQNANFKDDVVTLSLSNNNVNSNGIIKNKVATTTYNTDSGEINLNLLSSKEGQQNGRINNLNFTSATKDFNTKATFNSTKNNSDGSQSSFDLTAGRESDNSAVLGFANNRTVKTDGRLITKSNNATLTNNTEHVTSASYVNKKGVTINNADGTYTNVEREFLASSSTDKNSTVNYETHSAKTVKKENDEVIIDNSRKVRANYNGDGKVLDLNYNQIQTENGELRNSFGISGVFNEDGGETSVSKNRVNTNGRMIRNEFAANVSNEAQNLSLRYERNVNNTSVTPDLDDIKPKKSKSFLVETNITKVQTESYADDYDLEEDYDYSDGAGEDNSETGTDVNIKTRYRVGDDALSVETHNLDGGRLGYNHSFRNINSGVNANLSTYAQYSKQDGLTLGLGTSRVKRDEHGKLKNAQSASVNVNPSNGANITTGYAMPIKNGNVATYAQYGSKDTNVIVGGKLNKIIYKKDKTNEQSVTEEPDMNLTVQYTESNEDNQNTEVMNSIGNHEIVESDNVNQDLNNSAIIQGNRQIAGGYHITAEVGHASDSNSFMQYNIDAQGFVNMNLAGKNATAYARITSTNGQSGTINNIYGGQLNNSMQSDIHDVASGSDNMKKYKETSFSKKEISESDNISTIGAGLVAGNPDQTGTNFAIASNIVLENGTIAQYSALSRGEYVFSLTGDNRQAVGLETSYNINKNAETSNFALDAYYDHTFNKGKTRINSGVGFIKNTNSELMNQTIFTSFGARQQISKKVDLYGQVEFGQMNGFGTEEQKSDTYWAGRIGAQYQINKSTVVFGEYNLGHGSVMSQTRMIPSADKNSFNAGGITVGIGSRF